MKKVLGLALFLAALAVNAGELSWTPGVSFSGSPSYVSEFATTFRDNGGPMSPYGSHFGLKAEVRQKEFAGVLQFACATGKFVYDYSRTGLAFVSSVRFMKDGVLVKDARERRVRFEYYGWRETADFDGLLAESGVQFLGTDQYLISVMVRNTDAKQVALSPVFYMKKKGKMLNLQKSNSPGQVVFKFAVQPTVMYGQNFLAVLPSSPVKSVTKSGKAGDWQIEGKEIRLAPNEIAEFWYIFGYNPDSEQKALELAQAARSKFRSPLVAWAEMMRDRDEMFRSLPKPHLQPGQTDYNNIYLMAATALDNALYAPRGAMNYWGCVPTKVHYNWFWLWDSGFQALGYSEYKPRMATDVIQAIFQAQRADGFIAHMEDERAQPITPHSQPPVFGFTAGKIINRYWDDPYRPEFEKEMYEKGRLFLDWWKKARDKNHNGVFEYISQDEGGWDNSPRMNYVPAGPFISYVGSLGEVVASRIKPLDSIDLNPWMYFYYRAMSDWAEDLGKPDEAKQWRQQAHDLAGRIDQILWNEDCGCWLDGYNWIGSRKYQHFRTLTPAIWFPAFAGSTLDEKKARTVIEKHLLNPQEFYGKYPMPVVAYNDKYFDDTTPGWTASIWIFSAYSALEALFKFGYEQEAQELREKLLSMMADQDGMKGVYETYDPITGKYKNQHSTGGYASTQFGWSSAFTMEMILERYQEQRFLFEDTRKIQGFIRMASDFRTRDPFYQIKTGLDTPRLELESADGMPLLKSRSVKIKLSDPYRSFTTRTFKVWIKGKPFDLELGRENQLTI